MALDQTYVPPHHESEKKTAEVDHESTTDNTIFKAGGAIPPVHAGAGGSGHSASDQAYGTAHVGGHNSTTLMTYHQLTPDVRKQVDELHHHMKSAIAAKDNGTNKFMNTAAEEDVESYWNQSIEAFYADGGIAWLQENDDSMLAFLNSLYQHHSQKH